MINIREIDGKEVTCLHTGLFSLSDVKGCSVRSYKYSYVFVGSISAITPANSLCNPTFVCW